MALRMIGDREEEIGAFIPQEYWTLDALLTADGSAEPFTVHYYGRTSQDAKPVKQELENEAEVKEITEALRGAPGNRRCPLPHRHCSRRRAGP